MVDLRVELYGHRVGHLIGPDWRTFTFRTDPSALQVFELGSTVLSESVPLDVVPRRSGANRQRAFFAELLPEGDILRNLALRARRETFDVIGLLAEYGRDVAGAVQIYDPDRPDEPRTPHTTSLTSGELEALLLDTVDTPLGNAPVSGKSSLAGVQDKIVLAAEGKKWARVHDGFPSTHIVKPESRQYPTIIFDEEYGCRIARHLGLASHETMIRDVGSVAALFVQRYDRSASSPLGRIHQEDMNQALGARGSEKYQEVGGKVSLRRIAALFDQNGDGESMQRLFKLNILSVAIGNLDMHAKNISMLHPFDGAATLAPAYDVVPMRHMPNDGRMALSINDKYVHATISVDDLVAEAKSWGMQEDVDEIARDTLAHVRQFVADESPVERAHPALQADICLFVERLLAGKPAGEPTSRASSRRGH